MIRRFPSPIVGAPALLACAVLSSCTHPQATGPTSATDYLGDRSFLGFDQIVAAVRMVGPAEKVGNLHIGLAAIINPLKESWASESDVRDVVARLEPRIAARVVETAIAEPTVTPDSIVPLRERIAAAAQSVLDGALANWKHRDEYRVEMAITAFYLTSPSAPVEGGRRDGRWWGW
jgi:hypothetical protein